MAASRLPRYSSLAFSSKILYIFLTSSHGNLPHGGAFEMALKSWVFENKRENGFVSSLFL